MPHGHCYLWQPALVSTHVTSDLLIGTAYLSISLSLYALIRKIKLPFSAMVLSFGIFIGACGATHFMEIWNLWNHDYWLSGLIKVLTAIASVATGAWLIFLKPKIILVAEAAKLSESRREQLEIANLELAKINTTLAEQQKILAHSSRMSALGEMAAGIAHEINSPLGIITLHANQIERLQERGTLTPQKIIDEAQLISSTALRIATIIKGLRSYARVGDDDDFETVRFAQIVDDALILCQNRFTARGIQVQIDIQPTDLTIHCRSVQMVQVLVNLLNNSFDAVDELAEKWIKVEANFKTDAIIFTVTDSGNGIPAETAQKITAPFFTTKEVGKGTGLGLSISKGIIEAHGGTLELDTSCANTRFVVHLPKVISQNSL